MHRFRYLRKLKVWVNSKGLANILSFNDLEQHYPIKYGTGSTGGAFIVCNNSKKLVLKKNSIGLPYINIAQVTKAICLINTVKQNFEGHTKKEVQQAVKAREALAKIGHPTEREFAEMVRHNMIENCPVSHQDVVNANAIFGPNLPGLRGKMTRTRPAPVKTGYVAIPRYLLDKNKALT
ncbi:hypothetical protein ACHAXS_002705 [Conticribra weissflogii]